MNRQSGLLLMVAVIIGTILFVALYKMNGGALTFLAPNTPTEATKGTGTNDKAQPDT